MSELENRVHAGELAARASSVGCACGVRTCCRRRRRRPRLLQKPQHPHSRRHINTHTQKRLQQIRAARGESLGLFFWGGGLRARHARAQPRHFSPHTKQTNQGRRAACRRRRLPRRALSRNVRRRAPRVRGLPHAAAAALRRRCAEFVFVVGMFAPRALYHCLCPPQTTTHNDNTQNIGDASFLSPAHGAPTMYINLEDYVSAATKVILFFCLFALC